MSNSQVAQHSAYLLSYLSHSEVEQGRLDSQHDVITHAITGGELVHPSIPPSDIQNAIADIACGTGIWLKNVRSKYFDDSISDGRYSPLLVGFDVNSHAFDPSMAPAVTLIEHNCVQEFPSEYIGKFDLVNMRGLAYAIPEQEFCRLVSNATQLLRPGGYLQWLETETRLWKQFPVTPAFEESIKTINTERASRALVSYMPDFMLRQLFCSKSERTVDGDNPSTFQMSILHFNLLPGGICRNLGLRTDPVNLRLSATILESMRLLLAASLERNRPNDEMGEDVSRKTGTIERLMDQTENMITSQEVITGGLFPQIIAQRTF